MQPSELIFAVTPEIDGHVCILITPKAYFEEKGYLFDSEIDCEGLDDIVEAECDSMFCPNDENFDSARRQLLDLGLTEDRGLLKTL